MFLKVFLVLLFFNFNYFKSANGYKILGICPMSSRSHFNMLETLMKGLARKGHHVDVVSHYPQKKPYKNYKDLSLYGSIPDSKNNITFASANGVSTTFWMKSILNSMGHLNCELLGHPVMQGLINKSSNSTPYDLVIVQMFLSPCFFAFSKHFNIPLILFSASGLYDWMTDSFGNPANPSFVPTISLGYTEHMNFQQRLVNTVTQIVTKIIYNRNSGIQNQYVEKYFGPGFPNIHELQKNAALVLVNSHYSLNGVRPFTAGVVEVGGLHLEEDDKQLPVDIEKWLDESEHGVVYITFGSMIKIESLPEKILKAFYRTFEKISPIRVLMKIANETELPPGLPTNVKTFWWLPQLNVLKHKNVKIFVTHGGLFSTTESIISRTPMIGIPLFTDQFNNINNYVERSIAIKLDIDSIDEENFPTAINNILLNPTYRNNVEKLSKLYMDRPLSPLETAIFWVEYVGRHGNLLKSPAMDLEWWQVYLLDVYAFILFIAFIFIYIIYFILRKLIRFSLFMIKDRKDLINKKKN